jgi:F0F1-type ATP synthase membrane subunit b/b'
MQSKRRFGINGSKRDFRIILVHIFPRSKKALTSVYKEIDKSAEETNTALDKLAAETNTALDKTRANLSKELRDDLIKALANIPADIESMRKRMWDDLIVRFGADMNMMVSDTRSLIRKNIEDEVREVVRKSIEGEVRAAVRKELVERRHRYSKKPPPPNVTDIGTKQQKA